ncbi:MAG: hypothetical protein MUE98_09260 [Rhodobacteraceae bacterium]|nr:hypothetical protein [Paracoccaceae bacterium]
MQTKRPTATAVPDITTVLKAARDRMAAGDLASARKTIVNVLKLAPGSVDGWNGLGHVCRLEGDHIWPLSMPSTDHCG